MVRLVLTAALCLVLAADASAWFRRARAYPSYAPPEVCLPVYPVAPAPLTPAIWGAPAPKPLPPAPPPYVPRPAIREEADDVKSPKPPAKPKDADPKEKDTPRIPKVPLLPGDPTPEPPKREPAADARNGVQQFLIPAAATRAEPRAEIRVGFFNHSRRAIELQVNGEPVQLPSEQFVTLRLSRTFTWSEKGQKGTDVVVPPEADGVEIVFRK